MNKKNLHTIFLSLAAFLTLILLIITPFWWTTGGLEEFKTWYPDWGILVWIVKWIFILISITSGLYLLSLLHKPVRENTFLFFLFVALSWRIGEQHPFSRILGLEVFENIDWYSEEDKVGLKLKRKLLITQNDKLIEEEKILYEKSLE